MAVVYAIKNGNWSDGSTWSSGVVPTVDDDVYANGYTVAINSDIDLGNGTVRNDLLQETGRSGGLYSVSGTHNYTANFLITDTNLFVGFNEGTIVGNIIKTGSGMFSSKDGWYVTNYTINGDLLVSGTGVTFTSGPAGNSLVLNGNLHLENGSLYNTLSSMTIVGNSTIKSQLSNNSPNVTTTGITEIYVDNSINNFTLNGKLKNYSNNTIVSNLTLNGDLEYFGTNDTFGLNVTQINLPSNYSFKKMIDSNPDYPSEDNVKKGVKYGYDNYEGVYEAVADYPQESTVLQGVEYGGDKVGTLEVIPSTATIIESANVVEGDITNVNMTDEQLQRIANCATMQEVAELSVTIANKDNE